MPKKRKGKKKTLRQRLGLSKRQRNLLLGGILLFATVIIGIATIPLTLVQPSISARPTGYCSFKIIDVDTNEEMNGNITLVYYNQTWKKFKEVETNKMVYLPVPMIATISWVNDSVIGGRVFFPMSISPICSDDPENPYPNSIRSHRYYDNSEIEATIVRLNETEGSFDHTSFNKGTTYNITLNITIDTGYNYSIYGQSCFTPLLFRPSLQNSSNSNVTGFGLWLAIDNSKIDTNETLTVNNYATQEFWIEELGISIILLEQVYSMFSLDRLYSYSTQQIIFTLTDYGDPTEIYIFNGFLDDLASTKITLS